MDFLDREIVLCHINIGMTDNALPYVIDTPFARIDTEHRANITEYFFKAHIDRGIGLLEQEARYGDDLSIHLTEPEKGI